MNQFASPLDPLGWLEAAWGALGGSLHQQVAGFLTATSGPLSLQGLTAGATVAHYLQLTRLLADAALAAVLVWAFMGSIWRQSAEGQHRLRLLLPRLLLASLLINFSAPLLQGAIDLCRALSTTVLQAGGFELGQLFGDVSAGLRGSPSPFAVVVAVGMFVSLLLLLVVYVLRYALVTVLAITAPVAALLFVLPETSEHARRWAALFVTSLFMQPLQLLILSIGWSLDTHDFGLGPLRHAFALACIVLCFRVPSLLHAGALRGRAGINGGQALVGRASQHSLAGLA